MQNLKTAFSLYNQNFSKIVLLLLLVLPLQFLEYILTMETIYIFSFEGSPLLSLLFSVFIALFFINITQAAFIPLASHAVVNVDTNIREIITSYFKLLPAIILYSILGIVAIFAGVPLLVIPAIFFLVLMLLTPYAVIIDQKSDGDAIKHAFTITKNHTLQFFNIIIFFICTNLAIWYAVSFGLFQLTNELLTFLVVRTLINAFMIPLFVMTVTLFYYECSPDSFSKIESF